MIGIGEELPSGVIEDACEDPIGVADPLDMVQELAITA